MTLVSTASKAATPFNGGTITRPLVLAMTSPTDEALQIRPPTGAEAAFTNLIALYRENGGSNFGGWDAATELFNNMMAGVSSTLQASDGTSVSVSGGTIFLHLGAVTTRVRVTDRNLAAIFEVREDGSLHGKTGQSLTFDL